MTRVAKEFFFGRAGPRGGERAGGTTLFPIAQIFFVKFSNYYRTLSIFLIFPNFSSYSVHHLFRVVTYGKFRA